MPDNPIERGAQVLTTLDHRHGLLYPEAADPDTIREIVSAILTAALDDLELGRILWSFTGANTPEAMHAAAAVRAHLLKAPA